MMENAEEIFQVLEDFSKRKPKIIPQELNDYLTYVARTGDPVYQWNLVKSLFKEKLLNVITDFYETTPGIDIPPYPNVDPFNYDIMKNSLLERFDSFTSAPFTVQRICELLTTPRKQYNRVDKFMRAIEKNILVVSTTEPGIQRHVDQENGESTEPVVNGSDNNSDYNVDVEMEDMSWKENTSQQKNEPQPSSSDAHITVDDIETRTEVKQDAEQTTESNDNKPTTQFESVNLPEANLIGDEQMSEEKPTQEAPQTPKAIETQPNEIIKTEDKKSESEVVTEDKEPPPPLVIPEIKVDDAEMTEQKLNEQTNTITEESPVTQLPTTEEKSTTENSVVEKPIETQDPSSDENSSEMIMQDIPEVKSISEVSTSSEESSSSDNTDGNSNSPKTDSEPPISSQDDSQDTKSDSETLPSEPVPEKPDTAIVSENYSISDVNSELQVPNQPVIVKTDDVPPECNVTKPDTTADESVTEEKEIVSKIEDTGPKVETEVPQSE